MILLAKSIVFAKKLAKKQENPKDFPCFYTYFVDFNQKI